MNCESVIYCEARNRKQCTMQCNVLPSAAGVWPVAAASDAMDEEKVFLVCATWDFEGSIELVAFKHKDDADQFISRCETYQETEPDDDYHPEWENNHPAKPYLGAGDTVCGAESFFAIEITVL